MIEKIFKTLSSKNKFIKFTFKINEVMMKRIDKVIDFDSEGESGNIFWIMSQVIDYLEKEEIKEYVEKIKKSHSYKEALSITREYIILNDIRGKY